MIAGSRRSSAFTAVFPNSISIALLTLLFRGLLLPYLIWRIIRRLNVDREIPCDPAAEHQPGSRRASSSCSRLTVSFRVAGGLPPRATVAVLALTVMLSMKLIGFLMLAVRHEAISQILGLLVLENGIFLGTQILVPGMPLLIEIVILFDLLIVVACFGVLVGYLLTHVGDDQQPRD